MFDVLSMVEIADPTSPDRSREYLHIVVDPAKLYPLTIAHIREQLKQEKSPDSSALRQEYDAARLLPDSAWDLALKSKDAGDSPLTPTGVEQRAAALEIARRWFTEVLHQTAGEPIHLRILRNDTFKL